MIPRLPRPYRLTMLCAGPHLPKVDLLVRGSTLDRLLQIDPEGVYRIRAGIVTRIDPGEGPTSEPLR
jgi:hypothetical protein